MPIHVRGAFDLPPGTAWPGKNMCGRKNNKKYGARYPHRDKLDDEYSGTLGEVLFILDEFGQRVDHHWWGNSDSKSLTSLPAVR